MTDEEKELVIEKLLESTEIRKIYDTYIIKSIPFETWVRDTTDRLLAPAPNVVIDADEVLAKVMGDNNDEGFAMIYGTCKYCGETVDDDNLAELATEDMGLMCEPCFNEKEVGSS